MKMRPAYARNQLSARFPIHRRLETRGPVMNRLGFQEV